MFATWGSELLKKTFSLGDRRPTLPQHPPRSASGSGSSPPPPPPPPRSAAAQARRQRYQHRRRQLRRLGGPQADAGTTTTTDSASASTTTTTTTDPSNAAGEGEARSSVEGEVLMLDQPRSPAAQEEAPKGADDAAANAAAEPIEKKKNLYFILKYQRNQSTKNVYSRVSKRKGVCTFPTIGLCS